jgi:hypothetical protein
MHGTREAAQRPFPLSWSALSKQPQGGSCAMRVFGSVPAPPSFLSLSLHLFRVRNMVEYVMESNRIMLGGNDWESPREGTCPYLR